MIGHYKRSKFLAEQVALEAARAGAPVVIVNPSTPIGPGDVKPTPTGQIVLDAAAGRMPAYVDTGLNIVHVDDVAAGHLLALQSGRIGERYILGGQDMSLRDILAGSPAGRPQAAARPAAARTRAADRLRGGSGGADHRASGPPHGRGGAHGEEAHVFLEREGGTRTRLPLASASPRVRGRRGLVPRAGLPALIRRALVARLFQREPGPNQYWSAEPTVAAM